MLLPSASVNQRLPSGPSVIVVGRLAAVGTGNSVMLPEEQPINPAMAIAKIPPNARGLISFTLSPD
jgi:hypothetical protein